MSNAHPCSVSVCQARRVSFDLIVCADWSKHPANRAVWMAAPAIKEIRRLEPTPGEPWTVARVLEHTTRLVGTAGSALVSFDAPIGVPDSYLAAARAEFGASAAATFLDWLPLAAASCEFWDPVRSPADWSVRRPFFVVPKGKGSLDGFNGVAAAAGIELRRDVEFASQGKSVFAFGLPGQVAPAAQALWRELLKARNDFTSLVVWPFEGSLDVREQGGLVVAENYPRAAYGTALSAELPAKPRALSKTKQPTRAAEVINLQTSLWLADSGVSLNDLPAAVASEDDFDALMTVTALLRLTLAGRPLTHSTPDCVCEGGILGA
ncbi:MAG: hypothetical protein QOG93_815 [Gaiellaceae bacterium]|nr:hypothetical protein [Gaiellaceae bacterium]